MTRKEKGWQHFVAGNAGGVVGLAVSFPLDTVKIRLQTAPDSYRGMVHCLQKVVRKEGAVALYRGLLSPVMGYGIINAASFGTYGAISMRLRARNEAAGAEPGTGLSLPQSMAAGAVAGFGQSFVRAPIERVKTLCQAHAGRYRGSWHCAAVTTRREGVLGLMRGLVPTVAREVPQYALYYPIYEFCKRVLTPVGETADTMSPARLALAGGLAGTLQWLPPIYSVDVIKSRMQSAGPGVYSSMWDCARKSVRADGIRVMWRGLAPALVRAFPLHGSIFCTYEVVMRLLRDDSKPAVPAPARKVVATAAAAAAAAATPAQQGEPCLLTHDRPGDATAAES